MDRSLDLLVYVNPADPAAPPRPALIEAFMRPSRSTPGRMYVKLGVFDGANPSPLAVSRTMTLECN